MQMFQKFLIATLFTLVPAGSALAEEAAGSLPAPGALPAAIPGSGGMAPPGFPSNLPPAYPEWPERSFRTEFVPPPPPGPYMSSAMSGVHEFPDNRGGLRNEFSEPQIESPFFSADMPWPDTPERDRPRAWLPESGEYRYVPDEIVRELEQQPPVSRGDFPVRQPFPRFPPPPPVRQPYFGYY